MVVPGLKKDYRKARIVPAVAGFREALELLVDETAVKCDKALSSSQRWEIDSKSFRIISQLSAPEDERGRSSVVARCDRTKRRREISRDTLSAITDTTRATRSRSHRIRTREFAHRIDRARAEECSSTRITCSLFASSSSSFRADPLDDPEISYFNDLLPSFPPSLLCLEVSRPRASFFFVRFARGRRKVAGRKRASLYALFMTAHVFTSSLRAT